MPSTSVNGAAVRTDVLPRRNLWIPPSAVAKQYLRVRRDPTDGDAVVGQRLWLPRWGCTVRACAMLGGGWLCVGDDDLDQVFVANFDIATGIEPAPVLRRRELLDIWCVVVDARCGADLTDLALALAYAADPLHPIVETTNRWMRQHVPVLVQAGLLVLVDPPDTYRIVLPMR